MIPFYNLQSYPNTYYTKLKGNPPKTARLTLKSGMFNVELHSLRGPQPQIRGRFECGVPFRVYLCYVL